MNLTRQAKFTAAAWMLLLAFLVLTEPVRLPVVALIVPFVLLFAALFGVWASAQQIRLHYSARGRPHSRLGAVICASVVLLLALQSLGQLSLRDVLTVLAIVAVGYFYSARASFWGTKLQANTYETRL